MEYIAIAKNIKMSPRKMRLVVDSVKKDALKTTLVNLSTMNKRAAGPIKKAIDSAVANAVNNFKADRDGLSIKDIFVTEGISMKRFHYAARGRVRPYKKRTSHVKVILSDSNTKSPATNAKEADEKSKMITSENPTEKQKQETKEEAK